MKNEEPPEALGMNNNMEYTNTLFEQTTHDAYDVIQSELESKRDEHKKLLAVRSTLRNKIHEYESSAIDLRDFLLTCQRESTIPELSADIQQVLPSIPMSMEEQFGTLRTNLHGLVLRETRYIRMRIHILEEILEDMRNQSRSVDGTYEYQPSAKCPICYENTVGQCLAPCGHCLCDDCHERDPHKEQCCICRSTVKDVVKLYLT